jgi:alpha-N-arabinofuranosidase
VRTIASAPRIPYQRVKDTGSLFGLAGSASVKDKTLTVTVVNPHVSEPRAVEISVRGSTPSSARAVVLAASDIHAHNTFDQPRAVQRREQKVNAPSGGMLVHELPPASVTRLTLTLG